MSALGGVYTLDMSRYDIVCDVSVLSGVNTLILRLCQNVTDVRALGYAIFISC